MRIIPPVLLLGLIAAIAAADRFLPLLEFASPWLAWLGAGVFALGVGSFVAAMRHFRKLGANFRTFEDTTLLVTDGPFRYCRNPMYLGMALVGAGAALISGTLAALLLWAAFVVVVQYWYIAFEERAMRRQFGEAYEAYCRQVGRWLGRRRDAPPPGEAGN